jgi:hypothetical protein
LDVLSYKDLFSHYYCHVESNTYCNINILLPVATHGHVPSSLVKGERIVSFVLTTQLLGLLAGVCAYLVQSQTWVV